MTGARLERVKMRNTHTEQTFFSAVHPITDMGWAGSGDEQNEYPAIKTAHPKADSFTSGLLGIAVHRCRFVSMACDEALS
jgi:hypothetical protein